MAAFAQSVSLSLKKPSFQASTSFFGGSSLVCPARKNNARKQVLQTEMAAQDISSAEEFNTALSSASDKLVVVDWFTSWCGPCKLIAPKFEAFSDKYADAVFLKVQGDKNDNLKALAKELQIRVAPTFQFYRNGQKVHQFTGAHEQELERAIVLHMAPAPATN
mmetsp:Transcript_3763/g.6610  ORF Transcript_3763/g.6610 Transcript_3763/m.6610 type:complete len:163 (-) Transcript_3763:514-1002(-)|eukprot:CAMPEP_0196652136 /NCGR_PEP_ID=MMETSP1086-20130531/1344_1 /TAXON_ID=77921 /ORGANISM="Cyanoptyche  gloeocystis , Strain SAG4.97" /LENGTH=162 /DNA_ID=CAMNT_0041982513 /DNA_START=93 /DNA_END=581 /DNA_ORIENTATION=+